MQIGLEGFVNAVQQQNANVALVDCSVVALTAGQLASSWKIPMIGFGTTNSDLSDKATYSTFSRVIPPYGQVSK